MTVLDGDAEFGRRVKALRVSRGMSQAELAGEAMSVSYVSLLESGRRTPNDRVVAHLAEQLGVAPGVLLEGEHASTRSDLLLDLRFAELALASGDDDTAREGFEAVLGRVTPDDAEAVWRAERGLGRIAERVGDLAEAIRRLEELRERGEDDPARWPWLDVVIDLSRCYREAGDLARSVDVAERATAVVRRLGLVAGAVPRLGVTLAGAYRERGDLARATFLLDRVLGGLDQDSPRRDRGSALWNAAIVAAERGLKVDASLLAERALALFAEEDDARSLALLRTLSAWILLDSDPPDATRARTLLRQAHTSLRTVGSDTDVAYAETELARAELQLGDAESARRWAVSSLERLGDESKLESARARTALAQTLNALGESAAAHEEMLRAVAELEAAAAGRQAASAWREIADVCVAAGDPAAAGEFYRRALDDVGVISSALRRWESVMTAAEVGTEAPAATERPAASTGRRRRSDDRAR